MRRARLLLVFAAVAAWSGCRTVPEPRDVPARITNPTPESRAELQRVVSEALHGAEVTLADDALTASSLLIVERKRPRDMQGRQMSGRDLGRPEQFRLIKNDSRCILALQPKGPRWELPQTTCAPE